MDERSLLICCFGIGIALQALLLQRGDWQPVKLLGCLAFSLLFLMPGKHEAVYEPLTHLLLFFSCFSVMFALAFKDDILPAMSEKLLLWYTLIFWFAFLSYFYRETLLQTILLLVMLAPTAATIIVAGRRSALGFTLKLLLYSWFLCLVVGLGLFQFPFYQLRLFVRTAEIPWVTPLESISAGMAFLYLAANATYVFYLIPLPAKGQSMADRMKQWHAFTDLMTQRFSDDVTTNRAMVWMLCGEAVLLGLDYRFHWVARETLINSLIVLPSALFFARRFQSRGASEPLASSRKIGN